MMLILSLRLSIPKGLEMIWENMSASYLSFMACQTMLPDLGSAPHSVSTHSSKLLHHQKDKVHISFLLK